VVIPLGVDAELLQAEPGENPFLNNYPVLRQSPYMLTLCRLHSVKNLEALIEVFLQLTTQAELRAWKLVIAGDGEADYVASLKNLVQQEGGEERVLFAGWLQGEEKLGALRGARLFALPSHQENFGLSVVEAMACSLPVLLSEHVNLAEDIIAAEAGWVVSSEKMALSQALKNALCDVNERTKRGLAGRELVRRKFTWPAVAEQLMQLYAAVLAGQFTDHEMLKAIA
jgi:glycosyltransferase involved in cell wall biosynthesis